MCRESSQSKTQVTPRENIVLLPVGSLLKSQRTANAGVFIYIVCYEMKLTVMYTPR